MLSTEKRLRVSHKLHKALWLWLADNPDKTKEEWPGFKKGKLGSIAISWAHCFACRVARMDSFHGGINGVRTYPNYCNRCPMEWKIVEEGRIVCGALFHAWDIVDDLDTKSKIALQIAHITWKYELTEMVASEG